MGRKTKKEKILADLRRKIAKLETEEISNQSIIESKPASLKNISLPQSPSLSTPTSAQSRTIYIYPVQLIKKDLTKTIILSILAISFELALFFLIQGKIQLPNFKISLPISFSLK